MNELPEGFGATYRCRNHAEREAVPPIALRVCLECLMHMRNNYAQQNRTLYGRGLPNLSTDGRDIDRDNRGYYRPRKD